MSERLTPEQEQLLREWAKDFDGYDAVAGWTHSALAELDRLRAERDAMLQVAQLYQPAGSPPPGGPAQLLAWILAALKADAANADGHLKEEIRLREKFGAERDRLRQRVADLESRLEKCEQSERARWNDIEN